MRTLTRVHKLISVVVMISMLSASVPPPAAAVPRQGVSRQALGQTEEAVVPTIEWVNFSGLRVLLDGPFAPFGTRVPP